MKIINDIATGKLLPELTILLDLSHEKSMERKKNQKDLDRLELQKAVFHKKVSEGYRKLAEENKERILRVDATLEKEVIHKIIVDKLSQLMA